MALLKMEIIQVRNQPMKFKPSFVILERKHFEMKRMENHPYFVNCNIPANDSIQYNVLFCESRTACFKLLGELGGNVNNVEFPVQSRYLLLAHEEISPSIFGNSPFKKSRNQSATRNDRDANHSTSTLRKTSTELFVFCSLKSVPFCTHGRVNQKSRFSEHVFVDDMFSSRYIRKMVW